MNKDVEKIIIWRHNLEKNVGPQVITQMKQKNVYETYLEILSLADYGVLFEKEYAPVIDGHYYLDLQEFPKLHLNILCRLKLLKYCKGQYGVPGYYELLMFPINKKN